MEGETPQESSTSEAIVQPTKQVQPIKQTLPVSPAKPSDPPITPGYSNVSNPSKSSLPFSIYSAISSAISLGKAR